MSKDFDPAKYVRTASIDFGQREAERMEELLTDLPFTKDSQSPIETMFGCALVMELEMRLDVWSGVEETSFSSKQGDTLESVILPPVQGIYCFYQVKIGEYRVDFLVAVRTLEFGTGYFAVELDGHDFHEKTKSQAARDKSRDRYLQSRGVAVFRFSGSEVWNNPADCASSVLDDCFAALEARSKGAP